MSQLTFDAMIAGGSTVMEAWTALGSGAPYKKLIDANKLLLQMIDAQNTAMQGWGKTGNLTFEQFTKFQTSASKNYDDLIAKGFSQNLALQQMAPSLQTLVEMANTYKFKIDDGTMALIKQADAAGLMNGQQLSVQETMEQGFALMLKALGSDIPAAWQKYIDAANEAAAATNNVADAAKLIGGGINKYMGSDFVPETPAAIGFHGMVTGPRRFYIEPGRREQVDINPSNDNRRYSNIGGVTINVYNPRDMDDFVRQVKDNAPLRNSLAKALGGG
jgi:hypothetical protein